MLVLSGRSQIVLFLKELLSIQKFKDNEFNIPRSQPLPGIVGSNMPYTFIGDETFSLSLDIVRPFSGKDLSDTKRIFNYRLSRVRRNDECAFGILSNKWKIFKKSINGNVDLSILLLKTCCALHNFVRTRDGFNVEDVITIDGLVEIERNLSRPPNQSIQIRNKLADYFMSVVGSVPWQTNYIK